MTGVQTCALPISTMLIVCWVEAAEFKNQQTDVLAKRLAGLEESADEQVGVEEVVVWLTSFDAKAGQIGEPLQRDVIGHFEAEFEIDRHFGHEAFEMFGRGKLVVGRSKLTVLNTSAYATRQSRSNLLSANLPRSSSAARRRGGRTNRDAFSWTCPDEDASAARRRGCTSTRSGSRWLGRDRARRKSIAAQQRVPLGFQWP